MANHDVPPPHLEVDHCCDEAQILLQLQEQIQAERKAREAAEERLLRTQQRLKNVEERLQAALEDARVQRAAAEHAAEEVRVLRCVDAALDRMIAGARRRTSGVAPCSAQAGAVASGWRF